MIAGASLNVDNLSMAQIEKSTLVAANQHQYGLFEEYNA